MKAALEQTRQTENVKGVRSFGLKPLRKPFSSVLRLSPALLGFSLALAALCGVVMSFWIDRNDIGSRLAARFLQPPEARAYLSQREITTHHHQLRVTELRVHGSRTGGGSIAEVGGGLVVAMPQGRLLFLNESFELQDLGLRTRMNLEALRSDPLYTDPRFQVVSLRTHDLLAIEVADRQYDLYASYDRFGGDCIQFVVSRIRLTSDGGAIQPSGRWTDVWRADPCLRFKDRGVLLEGWNQGGRMVRRSEHTILVALGDNQRDGFYDSATVSVDPAYDHGKLIELNIETGAARRVAIGLRNPQGLAIDRTGRIWETEHGPQGGDEINLIEEGGNYGWPLATYGAAYGPPRPWPGGARPGSHDGYARPRFAFVPSIGINAIIEPDSRRFPNWERSLLVVSLRAQSMFIVRLEGDVGVYAEPVPLGYRLRDAATLRDGRIAILTDQGRLLFVDNAADPLEVAYAAPQPVEPTVEEALGGSFSEVERGRALFAGSCAQCHSLDGSSGQGPPLDGVVGRRIASVESFAFSAALKAREGVWTEERLADFVHYPNGFAPGAAMATPGLHDHEALAVIRYLRTTRSGRPQ